MTDANPPSSDRPVENRSSPVTRRRVFLASLATGLAGCSGSDDDATRTATTQRTTTSPTRTGASQATDTATSTPVPDSNPYVRETNARQRFRDAGEMLDPLDSLDGWTVEQGSAELADSTAFRGDTSISLMATSQPTASISRSVSDVDFTAREPSLALSVDVPDYAVAGVALVDAAGREAHYANVFRAGDGWIRSNAGLYELDDGFDRATVETLRVFLRGGSTGVTGTVDALRTHPRPDRGRCVLTFDDATVSHYEKAFPMFEEYGFDCFASVPAYYLANDERLSMMANVATEDRDPMTVDQLRELQDAGWEIGAEMYTHPKSAQLPREQVEQECYRVKRWLREHDFAEERAYLTYPYGSHDEAVVDVASDYFALGRTVIGHLNRVSLTDPLHVAGHGVYSETVEETKRLVDRADVHDQLLVLNFHGFDEYAWKEMRSEDVREVLDYLDASGLQIQTYSELWDDMVALHGV